MAGIRDVAKKAGVGVGTVSRMMNESGYVSEDTKERIRQAMEELHYTPNELARNLYHKKSGIVAILIPSIAHPYFSEFVEYAEASLYAKGYKVMLCCTANEKNAEMEYLDMLNRHIVDGVINGAHSLSFEQYRQIRKPIVALDRYLGENIPLIGVDHREGGRIAAQVLVENGCRKVLHFRDVAPVATPYQDRHTEFSKIMHENGVECYDYELEWNRFDVNYPHVAVEALFEKGLEFDGVFGVDQFAITYMNALLMRRKRIPKDCKIVAYDGTFVSRMSSPPMTMITQPIRKVAEKAVEILAEEMGGTYFKNKQVLLDVEFIQGETTWPVEVYLE